MTVMYCTLMWMCLKCVRVKEREWELPMHGLFTGDCISEAPQTVSLSNCFTLCMNVPHRDGLVKCSDEVIYTQCFYPPWWKDVLMLMFRLKNSDFNSIFWLCFFIYSIYIFLYVILCMYITYMGMQLQSASPVFVCVGATDTTFATAICRKSNALTVIPLDGHCSLYKQIGDLL